MVADTEPLYAAHRLFVAPARFAAGAPYKVYEAASFGLPVVATELLREQLGWEDGLELPPPITLIRPGSLGRSSRCSYDAGWQWRRIAQALGFGAAGRREQSANAT